MIIQSGDLNIQFDKGAGSPDEILQRLENGSRVDCKEEGAAVSHPVKVENLPPGQYRMVKP